MSDGFFKWASGVESETQQYAIAPGIVENNLDLLGEGRVQVRIPSRPGLSPYARVVAIGGGMMRGFLWVPQIKDEVLVAFNQNDERDAYIIGGLWSTLKRPPGLPFDGLMKRIIKTGILPGVGHEIEFDDVLQSFTIKTSTGQIIRMAPTGVQIISGANIIFMTFVGPPAINLSVGTNTIVNLSPAGVTITAPTISLNATSAVNITGPAVNITGGLVKIN
jgi:phage baseplate assembly protein gpV